MSQIKEHRLDYTPVFSELPTIPALDLKNTEPKRALDMRMVKKGNQAITQALIKWKHLPEESATWEDWDVLKTRFPSVLAWGQASSLQGVLSRLLILFRFGVPPRLGYVDVVASVRCAQIA